MATFNLFVVNFQVKSPTTPPRPITIPNAVLDDRGNRTKPSILTWDGNPAGGQAAAGKQDIYGQYPAADAYRRGVRTALTAPASAHPKDIAAILANHVTTLLDTSQPTGWDVFGNPVSFGSVSELIDIISVAPFDRPVLTSGGAPGLLFAVEYQIFKANAVPGPVFQYRRAPVKIVVSAASIHPADLQVPINANVSLASGEAYDILNAQPIVQGTEGPSVWS